MLRNIFLWIIVPLLAGEELTFFIVALHDNLDPILCPALTDTLEAHIPHLISKFAILELIPWFVKIQLLGQYPFKKKWQQAFHFLVQYSYTWNTHGEKICIEISPLTNYVKSTLPTLTDRLSKFCGRTQSCQ